MVVAFNKLILQLTLRSYMGFSNSFQEILSRQLPPVMTNKITDTTFCLCRIKMSMGDKIIFVRSSMYKAKKHRTWMTILRSCVESNQELGMGILNCDGA